jgi:hypothetical protein
LYYSDHFMYSTVITSSTILAELVRLAILRNDVAIVAASPALMESQSYERKIFVIRRRKQEIQDVRAWVKAHPEKVAKILQKDELRREKAFLEA